MDEGQDGRLLLFSFSFSLQFCLFAIFICCIVMGFRRFSIIALSVWRWLAFWLVHSRASKKGEGGERMEGHFTFHISHILVYTFIFTSVLGCLYLSLYTLFTSLSLLPRLIYKCIPQFIIHTYVAEPAGVTQLACYPDCSCATLAKRNDNQQNCRGR